MTRLFSSVLLVALAGVLLFGWLPVAPKPAVDIEQSAPTAVSAAPSRDGLLAQLGIDRYHAAGYRGQGVKVAVIDSGFRGWQRHLGKALPNQIQARAFRDDGEFEARDSQHGVLCGEIVHALAPEAELIFTNWEADKPDSFLRAVVWAKQQGARVLTCSVIMPSWSDGEGGGPVHAALAPVLGPGSRPDDLLCFACAGNIAQRHWSGPYRPGPDGTHLWPNHKPDNIIAPWSTEERVSVELCWPIGSSYTLHILDLETGSELGRAPPVPQPQGHCAVVRFFPRKDARYAVRVRHVAGRPAPFHLAVLGGYLDQTSARGSIAFPADGAGFVAMGAVDHRGQRAVYSSCGPNSPWPKPDFVAPVPFPSEVRREPFSGTSAAAPQAAALAALILSRHPEWSPDQVRRALERAAIDVATPGFDSETGHGLLRLPSD